MSGQRRLPGITSNAVADRVCDVQQQKQVKQLKGPSNTDANAAGSGNEFRNHGCWAASDHPSSSVFLA
ncbi:MAG: hypothetical protein JWN19_534 [Arthrobacter sp.]|jgi:hypothetical protein|nr:hypothetical protein [Arthrobacter sp.]